MPYWLFIAGGAEENETPLEAAKRESCEETGLPLSSKVLELESKCTVPANIFKEWKLWPKGTYVVPEYAFAVDAGVAPIILSDEHSEFIWCDYDQAIGQLKWDSNKTALWELSQRLKEI